MDYKKILTQAWHITKNNKVLWIFGALAAAGGGFNFNGSSYNVGNDDYYGEAGHMISNIGDWLTNNWIVVVVVSLLLFLIWLAIIVLSIIFKGSLFSGVRKATGGNNVEFKEHFQVGVNKFWTILGIHLIIVAIIAALIIIATIITVLLVLTVIGILFAILWAIVALCGIFLISLALGMFINYTYCFAIYENKGVVDSLKAGFYLMKQNFLPSLAVMLINMVIGIAYGVASLVVILFVVGILVVIGVLAYAAIDWMGIIIIGILGFLIVIGVGLFLRGLINTYVTSVWVLTFFELNKTAKPRISSKTAVKM